MAILTPELSDSFFNSSEAEDTFAEFCNEPDVIVLEELTTVAERLMRLGLIEDGFTGKDYAEDFIRRV